MKITVIGLGHLGTVAAGGLAIAGHQVTGVDIDDRRIEKLKEGVAPVYEPGLDGWGLPALTGAVCASFT